MCLDCQKKPLVYQSVYSETTSKSGNNIYIYICKGHFLFESHFSVPDIAPLPDTSDTEGDQVAEKLLNHHESCHIRPPSE